MFGTYKVAAPTGRDFVARQSTGCCRVHGEQGVSAVVWRCVARNIGGVEAATDQMSDDSQSGRCANYRVLRDFQRRGTASEVQEAHKPGADDFPGRHEYVMTETRLPSVLFPLYLQ